jgi:flagellar protein FlgJ
MNNHHRKMHEALHGSKQNFILSAAAPAHQCELKTGVPASVTIAQAILESGWGVHHIGNANNYFGVKAFLDKSGVVKFGNHATGYVNVKTHEHEKGKDFVTSANFRAYSSMADSFLDHGEFLAKNRRYRSAIEKYKKNGDADEFAHGLQSATYATDPNYAKKLIDIMKKYNLYRYNSPTVEKEAARLL